MKIKKMFIVFILVTFLGACGVIKIDSDHQIKVEGSGVPIGYELFYVEGMPCMRFSRIVPGENGVWDFTGVSCDWSQWNGQ